MPCSTAYEERKLSAIVECEGTGLLSKLPSRPSRLSATAAAAEEESCVLLAELGLCEPSAVGDV